VTPGERRRRFLASIRAQIRRRHRQIDEQVLAVLGTLAELRQEMVISLEVASDFDASRIPQLLGEIDRQLERWTRRALGEVEASLEAGWALGPAMVEVPLSRAAIEIGRVILPDSLLDVVKGYSANRIKAIGPAARRRIERQISLGVLGGRSPFEVMKDVQAAVGQKHLGFIGFRAETITRTEMGRIHSLAADRRLRSAAGIVRGLKKQWRWSGISRVLHQQIDDQVREVDELFDLPDGVRMAFPRDPDAPVEHVANCGCESVPYMDAF
jgi:hypothetical protein